MVAIVGDSGTGKAALCAGLRAIYGDGRFAEVHLDGYFSLNRVQRNALGLTPLHPRTHDFAAMDEGLWELAHGNAVTVPVYDHTMGAVSGTRVVEPGEIVVVQGRFPLYTHVLRALFDVSAWLEREPGYHVPWTVHRDLSGAPAEQRHADYETYVVPQMQFADVRVRFSPAGVTVTERDGTRVEADPERAAALVAEMRRGAGSNGLGRYEAGGGDGAGASHALALAQLSVARHIDAAAQRRREAPTAAR